MIIDSRDAAALVDLGYDQFRRLVHSGKGPPVRQTYGGQDWFDPEEVKEWAASRVRKKGGWPDRGETVKFHFIIPRKHKDIWAKEARRRGITLSRLIHQAVWEYIGDTI